jgi:hypothetical protein
VITPEERIKEYIDHGSLHTYSDKERQPHYQRQQRPDMRRWCASGDADSGCGDHPSGGGCGGGGGGGEAATGTSVVVGASSGANYLSKGACERADMETGA